MPVSHSLALNRMDVDIVMRVSPILTDPLPTLAAYPDEGQLSTEPITLCVEQDKPGDMGFELADIGNNVPTVTDVRLRLIRMWHFHFSSVLHG